MHWKFLHLVLKYLKERNFLRDKFFAIFTNLADPWEKFTGSQFVKLNPCKNKDFLFRFSELAKLIFLHKVLYQLAMVITKIFCRISDNTSGDKRIIWTILMKTYIIYNHLNFFSIAFISLHLSASLFLFIFFFFLFLLLRCLVLSVFSVSGFERKEPMIVSSFGSV